MIELDYKLKKKKYEKNRKQSCSIKILPNKIKNRKFEFFTIIIIIKFQRIIKKFINKLSKIKLIQRKILTFLFYKKFPHLQNINFLLDLNKALKFIEPLEQKLFNVKRDYFDLLFFEIYSLYIEELNKLKTSKNEEAYFEENKEEIHSEKIENIEKEKIIINQEKKYKNNDDDDDAFEIIKIKIDKKEKNEIDNDNDNDNFTFNFSKKNENKKFEIKKLSCNDKIESEISKEINKILIYI
jgi:hypothetical protein